MTEYSRIAKGNFTATGAAATATSAIIVLPFIPDYVELWNYTNIKTKNNSKVTRAWWDAKLLDGTNNPTMIECYDSGGVTRFDVINNSSSNLAINTFQGALSLQFGPAVSHGGAPVTDFSIAKSGASGAGPATTVTTSGNHGLNTGDVIIFSNLFQTSTTGFQQIAGIPFVVTVTSATTFTIFWDSSGSTYAAFNTATSTNNAGSYKKILFPNLYLQQDVPVGFITTGATTTVKTTVQHNLQVGDEVAFRIPTIFGPTQLNSLPNSITPGSPIYGVVTSLTDFQTFVVNINSTSFTSWTSNFGGGTVLPSLAGQTYAQVLSIGEFNTGGTTLTATSPLFPSPQFSYASLNDSNTINGPAIVGAFFNNTRQGFTISTGTATVVTAATLITTGDIVYWHAYAHDFGNP